jgi:hypothetical protein
MNDTSLPLLLARWFDDRLHDSVGFCLTGCRLYGLELIDDDALRHGEPTAVRAAFLVEGADRDTVVRDPSAVDALQFDAVALVSLEWRPIPQPLPCRPGEFVGRRRARVVDVMVGHRSATVLRFEADPGFVVLAPTG